MTNRAVRTIDANGNTTTLVRDAGGLITETRDPLGHQTRLSYNAMGDPVKMIDPLGRTTQMQYDLDQRPTAEIAADGVVTRTQLRPGRQPHGGHPQSPVGPDAGRRRERQQPVRLRRPQSAVDRDRPQRPRHRLPRTTRVAC